MHFTVLIFGDNVEDQLEPFYELECSMDQEEMRNDSRAKFVEEFTTEELEQDFIRVKNEHPEHYYETLKDFAEDYHGYHKNKDDENSWGRWTNPNSKWDWYSVGGRWSGAFKVKDNPKYYGDLAIGRPGVFDNKPKQGYADCIRLGDIDFEGMRIDEIAEATKNWKEAQQKILDGENHVQFSYGIHNDDTEESYIKRCSTFSTYSYLKDGEWISNNENDNFYEDLNKILESLPEDTLLTMVDCHV